jgi:hypothetical protein
MLDFLTMQLLPIDDIYRLQSFLAEASEAVRIAKCQTLCRSREHEGALKFAIVNNYFDLVIWCSFSSLVILEDFYCFICLFR